MAELYVELRGGFGNQLFQWAAAHVVRAELPATRIIFDEGRVARPGGQGNALRRFGIPLKRARSTLGRVLFMLVGLAPSVVGRKISAWAPSLPPARGLSESNGIDETVELLRAGRRVWLRGYVQQAAPLLAIRDRLRVEAQAVWQGSPWFRGFGSSGAVLHVRRGDYLDPRNSHIGTCSIEYYTRALALLDESRMVTVVSDDPGWCQDVLLPRLTRPAVVRESKTFIDDFLFLVQADFLTASNSTFSWWAGFFSRAEHLVGPSPWFDSAPADGESLLLLFSSLIPKHP